MPVIKSSNPVAEHWLTIARNKKTISDQFRSAIENIGIILFLEAINDVYSLRLRKSIKTPLKQTKGVYLDEKNVFLVPVLRAGLSMFSGIKKLIPESKVAHAGLYRNEQTLEPHWYLDKLPKKITKKSVFFILEPMLATAGTISAVLDRVILLRTKNIIVLGVIASREAKKKLEKRYNFVKFYVAGIDSHLNEKGYIVPGLGDAGDRAFNM